MIDHPRRVLWLAVKGFTHSLVYVKHLHDWLDHRIQATLEVGWHWKYGYCDPNELVAANFIALTRLPWRGNTHSCLNWHRSIVAA